MGWRSTSSTKSGKFLNPTDQARKEARKKELKKNKKQRMMVRAAALKMKDPKHIIQDLETLDEMQFNPVQQLQLSEKVLDNKRKKLCKTFEILLLLYKKKNPNIYKELRQLQMESEQKRAQLSQYFDAVKRVQHVEVESIPLPDMTPPPSNMLLLLDIPLPDAQPPLTLKKSSAYGPPPRVISRLPVPVLGVPPLPPGRKPPGPPPGPPPSQLLQMYSQKVGFPLELAPLLQEEDVLSSPELAHLGHDDDASSTSKDGVYPKVMDQDKHDDGSGGRGMGRSDASSEEKEFMHGDEEERKDKEGRKSGLRVLCADFPWKAPKEKKNRKELSPLQHRMLRMAGQEIPEKGPEVEQFSEDAEEEDSEDSESEDTTQQQDTEESLLNGASSSPASQQQQTPPSAQIQAPPMPGPPSLEPPPIPPLQQPRLSSGLPPGPPPGALPFFRPPGMPGIKGPLPWLLPPGPPPGSPPRETPLRLPPPATPGILSPHPGMMHSPLVSPLGRAPPGLLLPAPLLNPGVVSAPPNLIQRPKVDDSRAATSEKKATANISAKPQITNPKAGVNRFVPTALRVQREHKGATAAPPKKSEDSALPLDKAVPKPGPSVPVTAQTKDDVYEAFMKLMEGLL